VRLVKEVRFIAAKVDGFGRESLRQLVDSLRQKLGSGVVVLATAEDGKVALITAVTKDLTARVHAGKLIQELAKFCRRSGGGRPDLAEAGGKDTSGIENASARYTLSSTACYNVNSARTLRRAATFLSAEQFCDFENLCL